MTTIILIVLSGAVVLITLAAVMFWMESRYRRRHAKKWRRSNWKDLPRSKA